MCIYENAFVELVIRKQISWFAVDDRFKTVPHQGLFQIKLELPEMCDFWLR